MAKIGIVDSGCGGLSVYREILKVLPNSSYIYYADNANCPYGEKSPQFIIGRMNEICSLLISKGAAVIVVACNTATSAAIASLRESFPIPFVGMEPAVKPAALGTRSGVIGVLATEGTLKGSKYLHNKELYEDEVQILEHAGLGFVELVERGVLCGSEAESVVRSSLAPLLEAGADTIVLGCTHYPFLLPVMQKVAAELTPNPVRFIDPSPAVARRLVDVLRAEHIEPEDPRPGLELLCSGSREVALRLLGQFS